MMTKQKYSLIYVLLIISAACACSPTPAPDYALISGTISQSNSSYLTIKGDQFSTDIDLYSNGTFSDTLRVERGYYYLYAGREKTQLFLDKGYLLQLSADQSQFDNSLYFSGEDDGTKINNYLANKSRFENLLSSDLQALYSKNETDFGNAVQSWVDKINELLQVSEISDADFISLERRNIRYGYLTHLVNYEKYHQYATKNYNYMTPAGFEAPLDDLDIGNEQDFNYLSSYRNLIKSYISSLIERGDITKAIESIRAVSSQNIKTALLSELSNKIMVGQENIEQLYQGILSLTPDSTTLADLAHKMKKIRNLGVGMPSPTFAYSDISGQMISLSDLRGKYVYIDLWATWCNPCLKEIPALKVLQTTYSDAPILFVSLSIDAVKDFQKWQAMVRDKDLKGIQLFADQSWNSKFVTDYMITSIPRFILIDPNGNIIDANAPRPSNPEIRSILDRLINNS